jgi:two-component system sensor histidine kinase KdpD
LPLILVDDVLIEQLLCTILENAARYTPAGSTIEVAARTDGNRFTISIADNGPGLPPGSESHVFEKFYRGATSTADGRRGVGLGLSICQAVATAHGGTIVARNRPAGGAEFELRLLCDQMAPNVTIDPLPAAFASKT